MTMPRTSIALTARLELPLTDSSIDEPRSRAGRSVALIVTVVAILLMMVV